MERGAQLTPELRGELIALLPRLRRFARSLAGNADAGDDLAQAALEKALVNIARFESGTRLDSWMYKIAQNLWIDSHRAQRVRGVSVSEEVLATMVGEDGQRVAEAKLTFEATRRAIAELPEDQRAAVMLVLVDGLPYKDAAEILSIPIGTIMSRIHRARATLEAKVFG
jgi:RNA polymerase sigma-70 factor (ECF subfamily)